MRTRSRSVRSRVPGDAVAAAAAVVPLLSKLLRVRHRGARATRRDARQLARGCAASRAAIRSVRADMTRFPSDCISLCMDKRTLLALVLMALVIVVTPMLFSVARADAAARADSTARPRRAARRNAAPPTLRTPAPRPATAAAPADGADRAPRRARRRRRDRPSRRVLAHAASELRVRDSGRRADRGATITGYTRPASRTSRHHGRRAATAVRCFAIASPLGADTIALDTRSIHGAAQSGSTIDVHVDGARAIASPIKPSRRLSARACAARVPNAPAGLGAAHRPSERAALERSGHARRSCGISRSATSCPLRDVRAFRSRSSIPGRRASTPASMQWVAARNKYWLVALMQPVGTPAPARRLPRHVDAAAARASARSRDARHATTAYPLTNGAVRVRPVRRTAVVERAARARQRSRERESVRRLPARRRAAVRDDRDAHAALDEGDAPRELRLGARHLRRRRFACCSGRSTRRRCARASRCSACSRSCTAIQKKYKSDPDKQRDAMMKLYQGRTG